MTNTERVNARLAQEQLNLVKATLSMLHPPPPKQYLVDVYVCTCNSMFPILMPPSDYRALDLPLLQKVYLTSLIHCREYHASACVVRRIDLAGSVVKGQNSTWLSSISLALLDLLGRVLDAEDRYILLVKYCDSLHGPLVIYDPQDSYIHLYDVDNVHIDRREWTGTTMFEGTRPFGYGLRLVSLSCDPNYLFSIDNHRLTIIEADSVLTEPLVVDQLWTFAGQRYSIILNANQLIGNYWIRAIPSIGDASTAGGRNSAVLRYSLALPLDPISSYMPTNPLNESNLHALEDPEAVRASSFVPPFSRRDME
ncbi:hypothetical protein EW146_g9191 [Bondarzewia mesenterica]|uniref:Plastocyanin-like domain-containing protein n=1 Tax=Bondarzewia mesenterica TaxID=1095465 RepID=A0A4S4L894_9AGAM|nr:hypothetical protein EW146_g9191 [Bondarzewia mesenterica]